MSYTDNDVMIPNSGLVMHTLANTTCSPCNLYDNAYIHLYPTLTL